MKWLIHLLGGWTNEEHRKTHSYLGDRFEKEYWARKEAEKNLVEVKRIAIRLAGKYNELEETIKIDKL